MRHGNDLRLRLMVLGALGLVFFNYPLVALPGGDLAGVPGSVVYLFGIWLALIAVAALLAEKEGK